MSGAAGTTVDGGCHCGAVRYRVRLRDPAIAHRCNCSICVTTGFVGIIVPEAAFELVAGEGALREYRFNTGEARHWFCATCGVKSFYRPRSNPDGYNINLNCLELDAGHRVVVEDFDGRNWEANAGTIRHLSRPDAE